MFWLNSNFRPSFSLGNSGNRHFKITDQAVLAREFWWKKNPSISHYCLAISRCRYIKYRSTLNWYNEGHTTEQNLPVFIRTMQRRLSHAMNWCSSTRYTTVRCIWRTLNGREGWEPGKSYFGKRPPAVYKRRQPNIFLQKLSHLGEKPSKRSVEGRGQCLEIRRIQRRYEARPQNT